MAPMRRHPVVILLLLALVVAAPVVSAITIETWTDGIYDAESDYSVQAAKSNEAALLYQPVHPVDPSLVIVAVLEITGDSSAVSTMVATADPRAPPLA